MSPLDLLALATLCVLTWVLVLVPLIAWDEWRKRHPVAEVVTEPPADESPFATVATWHDSWGHATSEDEEEEDS